MKTVLYADLYFLLNFFANYVILYLTMRFSSANSKILRIVLSSLFGSFFAICVEYVHINGILLLLLMVICSLIMCLISFGRRSIKGFMYIVFFFYFSSVLLYGGMSAMYYSIIISNLFGKFPGGFFTVIALICISLLLFIVFSKLCTRAAKTDINRVKARIDDGKRVYELELYRDSGNLAKDPFSGKPVTVVSKSSLSPELYSAVSGTLSGEDNDSYRHLKPRVIPVKSVGGTTLLYAFIPKSMYVLDKTGSHSVDSIIAIDTRDSAFFGKDGIIPGVLTETL